MSAAVLRITVEAAALVAKAAALSVMTVQAAALRMMAVTLFGQVRIALELSPVVHRVISAKLVTKLFVYYACAILV